MNTQSERIETGINDYRTLLREIKEVKALLQTVVPRQTEAEELLTTQKAANFLGITVPTLYSKVWKREIPYMKRSKLLYFSRTDLLQYLKEGRKMSKDEIQAEAENYLKKKNPKN